MRVLSLFDGIACGRLALERAGIHVDRYDAYEIDESCLAVVRDQWGDKVTWHGNVRGVDWSQWTGKVDLLIGGFPCTFFSTGQQSNLRETKVGEGKGWELFSIFKSAIDIVKPKWFLGENVQSMSHSIRDGISKSLGVKAVGLNSELVSAQNRARYFWANFPITAPADRGILLSDILEEPKGLVMREKAYPISACGYNGIPFKDMYSYRGSMVYIPCEDGKYTVSNGSCTTDLRTYNNVGLLPDGRYNIRKLTVTEWESLQTLPKNYTLSAKSQTKRRRCIGNGWTVDLIAHIFSCIQ